MNLFGFFVKLTHPAKRIGWRETTAYFTGDARIPHRARGGYYPLMTVTSPMDVKEYAIRYYVDDQMSWPGRCAGCSGPLTRPCMIP